MVSSDGKMASLEGTHTPTRGAARHRRGSAFPRRSRANKRRGTGAGQQTILAMSQRRFQLSKVRNTGPASLLTSLETPPQSSRDSCQEVSDLKATELSQSLPGNEDRMTSRCIRPLWLSAVLWLVEGLAAYALALYVGAAGSNRTSANEMDHSPPRDHG